MATHFIHLFRLLAFASLTCWTVETTRSAPPAGHRGAASKLVASANGCNGAVLRQYRSQHFLLHTDLPDVRARAQLASLESIVQFAAEYWSRPSPGIIECYVADKVSSWPDAALPHPLARISMVHIGGATVTVANSSERSKTQRALFFARAGEGIAEHESVHAYCLQAFGATGPTWYKEGMAEVGCHCSLGAPDVCVPTSCVEYFQDTPRRTIREIVSQGKSTSDISRSLREMVADEAFEQQGRQIPLSSWTAEDTRNVHRARELYRWNWSLCHFLCYNPNYASRFHRLGQSYLENQRSSFEDAFADVASQAEFEYDFFLQHIGIGYRVDLASWDWNTRPCELRGHSKSRARIVADRGYQATSVLLSAGEKYCYQCKGEWCVGPNQVSTDADGGSSGRGRLIGVIQRGVELSKPFALGNRGVFQASTDGHLYVRCEDDWTELADNTGRIILTLRRE